jgi:hypothetical protein
MTERLILQPPEIVETDDPVIFLAGPIQGAPIWQPEAAATIHDLDPSIIVATPRKDYEPGTFVYPRQVDWETHFLRTAGKQGVVAFWLAAEERRWENFARRLALCARILLRPDTVELPRSYAQTSRFELAEWKMRHEYEGAKLTIGIEEGFGNARYIRRRFSQDCPDVKIADDLVTMCQDAVELAHQPN